MIATSSPEPIGLLQSTFSFPSFRGGQEAVVTRLLAGKSSLAIFPTGAGKSLCYQLPALLLEGVTLVVSPLIALMKDQIDFLRGKGIAAARLDSTVSLEEYRQVFADLRADKLKLLYIAPERLGNERFLQTLKQLKIAMLAVDEAHCISEWGHNFRPDYLKLAQLAKALRVGRVLALTATATPAVAGQIAAAFAIEKADVVSTGFYRSNLHLQAIPCEAAKRQTILMNRLLAQPRGPTIVYVTLQRTAEEVAAFLSQNEIPAEAYHAGLDPEKRHAVQDRFMQSETAVVVATIAFGMGIDKANIRAVYHYNLPKTLENYAQEIGRAGRDGEPAHCELLAAEDDVIVLQNFTFGDTPTPGAVGSLVTHVLSLGDTFDISTYELSFKHDIKPIVIETILTYLELLGLIESTGPFYSEYKFQPLVSGQQMLAAFDPNRAAFLKKLFKHATQAKVWWSLKIDDAGEATGEPRERIIAALNFLEEKNLIELQVAGVRQGYRVKKAVGGADELRRVCDKLSTRFITREQRDIARVQEVLAFTTTATCRWRHLLNYFGEAMEKDCGHCDRCQGLPIGRVPVTHGRALGEQDAKTLEKLNAERHSSLEHPRQLARFLCGLSSPQASRERLGRHRLFGAWSFRPFQEVLEFIERPRD